MTKISVFVFHLIVYHIKMGDVRTNATHDAKNTGKTDGHAVLTRANQVKMKSFSWLTSVCEVDFGFFHENFSQPFDGRLKSLMSKDSDI